MAVDINNIKPAIEKAKNVATEQYVDTSVANIDISNTLNTNNDVFAQRLGYMDYDDMVAAAESGQTIINGGYLRTSLIEANSINAGQINTVGLVAENISSNTIDGKTITGGLIEGTIINGVVITGATIRASYLDLDGELEVLTNFYLCVGGDTTGVPALAISEGRYRTYNTADIDAVPSSGYANIYRIPSISFVKEPSINFSTGTTYGTLRSYNTANVGHNMKAVKRRPTFQNLSGIMIATGNCTLRLGSIVLGTFYGGGSNPSLNGYFHDFKFVSPYTSGYNNRIMVGNGKGILYQDEVFLYNVPVFCDLRIERYIYGTIGEDGIDHWGEIKVFLAGGSHTLPFDWDNPSHVISIETPGGSTARISGIQINNMV